MRIRSILIKRIWYFKIFYKYIKDAEKTGDKVYLIAHIPSGAPDIFNQFTTWDMNFYDVVLR